MIPASRLDPPYHTSLVLIPSMSHLPGSRKRKGVPSDAVEHEAIKARLHGGKRRRREDFEANSDTGHIEYTQGVRVAERSRPVGRPARSRDPSPVAGPPTVCHELFI
ncbi:hypothetical protein M408DRAFT_245983 [Serendipita vermifera MAFF 305830]|uniref:Uncharacterized protein n=1 Tax=Serendipita vermifera MAFF 305830 TaxID=933852 RepID=A0A0C2WCF6_SERVB|nr:hypothetical protein M408DRAFT_245983 [Serendipita vermifera MAFF 305830]